MEERNGSEPVYNLGGRAGQEAAEGASASDQVKQHIVRVICESAGRVRKAGWPGLPIVWLPLSLAQNVGALVAEGVIRQIAVTKLSNAAPGRVVTHIYLALESDQEPADTPEATSETGIGSTNEQPHSERGEVTDGQ